MRFVLVTALFALLIAGTSLPVAAAGANDHMREKDTRDRATAWTSDDGPSFERRRVARATTSDMDEDYEVRPRQRYQSEDEDRPRAAKRRHAGKAKHARRHKRVVRRTARKVAHRDGRRQRRADTPAWTRRSLGYTGSLGSGQLGVASFYWQPQRVASGGWFNPNGMTAAHRTLPFGTRVRVTHAATGRSVDVRINDRGPYIAGRIIDLSRAAAGVIGMTGQGIARVSVTILGR
jgi:rare lipoprotein A